MRNKLLSIEYSPITHKSDFLLAIVIASIHVILTTIVYHFVPQPYMDEIFHIGQTRSYCNGNFSWNPLITTPPALYVLSMPLCGYERYVNSFLMFLAVPGFCRFRRMFSRSDVFLSSSVVSFLPILVQSSTLFYTDLLSLTAVVWGFTIRSPFVSALIFTVATLTRQTNIVWAAMFSAAQLLINFNYKKPYSSLFYTLFSLWPFELLALLFCGFIYWNNYQIVLGDAQAHVPKFHLAQFFYMVAFCTAHAWPHLLSVVGKCIRKVLNVYNIGFIVITAVSVYYFSYDHPYLLADNRHFTFYIWRRFLSNPEIRVALAPLYIFSIIFMNESVNVGWVLKLLFILSSFLVLVPAHLFEMRYYIIPYVLWRLSIKSSTFIFYLFIFKTFVWANHPNELQRFMF